MAEPFVYSFEDSLPIYEVDQSWERHKGKPLLAEVIGGSHAAISALEQFQALPERNQQLVLDMASFMLTRANRFEDRWKENFWGLYIVGSRAGDEARQDSDLDLLSVGTFYRDQGFFERYSLPSDDKGIFEGFDLDKPEELPSEYNVGEVDKKYLVRATPKVEGVLPVDLNVVDLTFYRATLDSFKETMDVAEDDSPLTRLPLVELSVAKEPPIALHW